MFQTLLVDDDFLVRSYLKTLDSWEKVGYEVVRDVQDGEEALEVINQEKIDIVVTDISMPLMDGIELIKAVKKNWPEVSVIVLSCHDDFEYVKEAMRLGADEYILKNTLDENSLLEVLEKAKAQIEAKKAKTTQEKHTKKLIQMGSHTLKYHFFNGVLSQTLEGEVREQKRLEAQIAGSYKNSAVIAMFMHDWNRQNREWTPLEAEQYSLEFRTGIESEIEAVLGEENELKEIIYLGAGIFCCFLDLSEMRRDSLMRQRLTDVAGACFRFCKKEPYSFGISVSSICIGVQDGLRQAYQQARQMMKYGFYDRDSILYYDCQKEVSRELPKSAEKLIHQVQNQTENTEEELEQEAVTLISEAKQKMTDGRILVQWLHKLDESAYIERSAQVYTEIASIEQFKMALEESVQEVCKHSEEEIPEGVSHTIKVVLLYLHQHYKEQISLQDVAEEAGVNSAYLSYLFKQEMGIGFANYLQECRMRCAEKMLCDTNLKIKEVAEAAGFNDYHYFSKIFKKYHHCSPADYRKKQ